MLFLYCLLIFEILDVKDHIVHVASIEKKKQGNNDLRLQLLKAAKNMTCDMSTLVGSLGESS